MQIKYNRLHLKFHNQNEVLTFFFLHQFNLSFWTGITHAREEMEIVRLIFMKTVATYKSDKIYSLASTHKQELALKNMASLSEII